MFWLAGSVFEVVYTRGHAVNMQRLHIHVCLYTQHEFSWDTFLYTKWILYYRKGKLVARILHSFYIQTLYMFSLFHFPSAPDTKAVRVCVDYQGLLCQQQAIIIARIQEYLSHGIPLHSPSEYWATANEWLATTSSPFIVHAPKHTSRTHWVVLSQLLLYCKGMLITKWLHIRWC